MGRRGQGREQVQGPSAGLLQASVGPLARASTVQKQQERERMLAMCHQSLGESFLRVYCVQQLA